jgi:glycosyltransferase involved in cell wall biosynthesis
VRSDRPIDIGLSAGTFDTPNHGLGEFAHQFGRIANELAPQLREQHNIRVFFYLRSRLHGVFGDQLHYLSLQPHHKRFNWSLRRFDLWHTLNQHVLHLPPPRAGLRLTTVHDLNYAYGPDGPQRAAEAAKIEGILARTDHAVAISKFVATDISRRTRYAGPISMIHNGAQSLANIPPQRPPVPNNISKFYFHLSRMAESKNISALLDLAAHASHLQFVFGGPDGADARAAIEQARLRNISNIVFLLDLTDAQKAWLYAHCTGFLFPSLCEGFGLPAIEAMHFGKPVFLSRLTSLPEVGGDAAFYFDSFAPQAMQAVLEDGSRRHEQDPQHSSFIMRHASLFNWQRSVSSYFDLYKKILGLAAKLPSPQS